MDGDTNEMRIITSATLHACLNLVEGLILEPLSSLHHRSYLRRNERMAAIRVDIKERTTTEKLCHTDRASVSRGYRQQTTRLTSQVRNQSAKLFHWVGRNLVTPSPVSWHSRFTIHNSVLVTRRDGFGLDRKSQREASVSCFLFLVLVRTACLSELTCGGVHIVLEFVRAHQSCVNFFGGCGLVRALRSLSKLTASAHRHLSLFGAARSPTNLAIRERRNSPLISPYSRFDSHSPVNSSMRRDTSGMKANLAALGLLAHALCSTCMLEVDRLLWCSA